MVNHHVVGLHIPVHDPHTVTVVQSLKENTQPSECLIPVLSSLCCYSSSASSRNNEPPLLFPYLKPVCGYYWQAVSVQGIWKYNSIHRSGFNMLCNSKKYFLLYLWRSSSVIQVMVKLDHVHVQLPRLKFFKAFSVMFSIISLPSLVKHGHICYWQKPENFAKSWCEASLSMPNS